MGLSVSKAGARGKAIEQAMSVLAAVRVTVSPAQRRWKDENYPDLVLTRAGETRQNLPPFFSPPIGTVDHRIEQERMKSHKKPKSEGGKSFSGVSIFKAIHSVTYYILKRVLALRICIILVPLSLVKGWKIL